jgi:hypothetical protein
MSESVVIKSGQVVHFPVTSDHTLAKYQQQINRSQVSNLHDLAVVRTITQANPKLSSDDVSRAVDGILASSNVGSILQLTFPDLIVEDGATMVLGGPITTLEAGNVIVLGEILVHGSFNLTCSTLGGIAPPAITSISPSTGSTLGGTEVTIQGSGFDSRMAVYFGSTPATRIDATDASINGLCTAWAPPMAKTGPVDITVRAYGVLSSSASAAAVFTYVYLPGVLSLNVSSNVLWTGQTFTGTITLNEPAASGGTTVTLSTLGEGEGGVAAAGVITAPASVSIPAGRTSATFPISVAASATTETVYFSATGPDGATQSTSVGLHTGQIFLTSPGPLVSGETAAILIFVRESAPESGGIISLSTNHADAISIPAQVPLPGGNTSATFPVTALKVTKVVRGVTISASYGGNSSTSEPFSVEKEILQPPPPPHKPGGPNPV